MSESYENILNSKCDGSDSKSNVQTFGIRPSRTSRPSRPSRPSNSPSLVNIRLHTPNQILKLFHIDLWGIMGSRHTKIEDSMLRKGDIMQNEKYATLHFCQDTL